MSQLLIVTTPPNSGDGTPLATAFNYCNSNFGELYNRYQTSPPGSLVGSIGDTAGMYASDSAYFYYCFANYDGSSTIWAQVTQVGNVSLAQINSGNSNVVIDGAGGNVTFGINGTSDVVIVEETGILTTGSISATGNITGDYILGNGSQLSGLPETYNNANVINLLANLGTNVIVSTANIECSNIIAQESINTPGIVVAGNMWSQGTMLAGNVSATGNITTDAYFVGTFVGNVTGNFVVPGANTQIIFNTAGNADAVAGLTYNKGSNTLTVLGVVSGTGNVIGGNVTTAGTITGASVVGGVMTGSSLSVTGNVTGASLIGTLVTPTQTAITSVGTLSSLSVSGNVQGGNLRTTGQISATGNIRGGNVITTEVEASGNITADGYTGVRVSVVGSVRSSNVITSGDITAVGNIFATNYIGNGSQLLGMYGNSNVTTLLASFGSNNIGMTGTISTTGRVEAASTVGGIITGTSLGVSGGITGASLSVLGNISGANITGTNITGTSVSVSGNVTGGNLLTGGLFSAAGAINGAAITGTSLNVGTGNISGGNIVNNNANGVGNIGSATTYFNTVFAKATSAQYADLAENYTPDAVYAPGTVVIFGGTHEITVTDQAADERVAGVISTLPAYLMNSSQAGLPVALRGKVPVRVIGPVAKGDSLVTATTPGAAFSVGRERSYGQAVFAKALEADNRNEEKVILAVII